MNKSTKYQNVKFIYVYNYIKNVAENGVEYFEKHPVAVICTGRIGTEFHGKVGVSICGENDKFVYTKGRSIAFQRLISNADLPLVGKTFIRKVKFNGHVYNVTSTYPEFMIRPSKDEHFARINNVIADVVNDIQSAAIANQRYAEYLANPETAEDWEIVKAELNL